MKAEGAGSLAGPCFDVSKAGSHLFWQSRFYLKRDKLVRHVGTFLGHLASKTRKYLPKAFD